MAEHIGALRARFDAEPAGDKTAPTEVGKRADCGRPLPTVAAAMEVDLHGHHPDDFVEGRGLHALLKQAWEMGESEVCFVHGHGRNRDYPPPFANTNTGFFGLRIREALRHDRSVRRWVKYTTLNCKRSGCTSIRLKPNPCPTRTDLDEDVLGAPRFGGRF